MESEQKQFKKIAIQNLQRKSQPSFNHVTQEQLIQKLDSQNDHYTKDIKKEKQGEGEIYCYQDTGIEGSRNIGKSNSFFLAFLHPYNNHGDILLVPDDIWIMISLFLSKYIDANAQKLRHQFVTHEGQKQLTIIEQPSSLEESLKMEKDWDFFFQQIIKQIRKNTLNGVVDSLKCDFTTTTKVYELISTSIIMASFKKYFKYARCMVGCGINNVYFDGTRQDWVKVQQKLKNLQKYDVDGVLIQYIQRVDKILMNFIKTYDGSPDKDWWNLVMTTEERRGMSGVKGGTYIQGWILDFFGIYRRIHIDDVPTSVVKVPIILINEFTQLEKSLQLITDWVSVSKISEHAYKPDIGMCIVERERKKL